MSVTIEQFESVIPKLAAKDVEFGKSLLAKWKRWKELSDKQAYWVQVLHDRVVNPAPAAEPVQIGGITRIREMFATASKKLKYPKIWLGTDANPIRLQLAGPHSKYAGSVMVTDGRPYGSNRFYGSIDEAGILKPGRDFNADVAAVLKALSDDPEGTASEFGRVNGCCCFCNTELTDDRSIEVGYGPVCARNFGLAWGAKAASMKAAA